MKNSFLLSAAVVLVLCTCSGPFSGVVGENSTVSITIGSGGRAALPWDPTIDTNDLEHTITISGGPGAAQKQEGIKVGQTARFTVAPGTWKITVQAYLGTQLIAEGSDSVDVKSGQNNPVSIKMSRAGGETPNEYTVTFNPNGGTGNMQNQTFTYGTAQNLSPNTYANGYYTFLGWDTDSAGTTVVYTNGQSVNNLAQSGTVTLYVVWGFTSIANFKTWLDGKLDNTAANPYNAKLNITDLGGDYNTPGSLGNALYTNWDTSTETGKYVNLDLSGNTFNSIPTNAFNGCISLKSITIPDSVTSIGNNAFTGCDSLANVIIPNRVTSIGTGAFNGCDSLASVTIPNRVTSIGTGAFQDCTSLTSVTIPESVTTIGINAFQGCTSLISVTFECAISSSGTSGNFAASAFNGDLHTKYIANPGGGQGTYTTTAPVSSSSVWLKTS